MPGDIKLRHIDGMQMVFVPSGSFLMGSTDEQLDDAIKVFLKNVHEYPESFMANDALAETYLKKGESKLAFKYFRIAVRHNPDYEYGRKIIEELTNK